MKLLSVRNGWLLMRRKKVERKDKPVQERWVVCDPVDTIGFIIILLKMCIVLRLKYFRIDF